MAESDNQNEALSAEVSGVSSASHPSVRNTASAASASFGNHFFASSSDICTERFARSQNAFVTSVPTVLAYLLVIHDKRKRNDFESEVGGTTSYASHENTMREWRSFGRSETAFAINAFALSSLLVFSCGSTASIERDTSSTNTASFVSFQPSDTFHSKYPVVAMRKNDVHARNDILRSIRVFLLTR